MPYYRYIASLLVCAVLSHASILAQADTLQDKKIRIDGEIVTARVENGDTIIVAMLDEASVTATETSFPARTSVMASARSRRFSFGAA